MQNKKKSHKKTNLEYDEIITKDKSIIKIQTDRYFEQKRADMDRVDSYKKINKDYKIQKQAERCTEKKYVDNSRTAIGINNGFMDNIKKAGQSQFYQINEKEKQFSLMLFFRVYTFHIQPSSLVTFFKIRQIYSPVVIRSLR